MIIISAIINLLVDIWSKWFDSSSEQRLEQRSGLWAGIALLCRGGGIDVVKIVQGVGQILGSIVTKSKAVGLSVVLLLGYGLAALGLSRCASWTRSDTAKVLDIVRAYGEHVCTPNNIDCHRHRETK